MILRILYYILELKRHQKLSPTKLKKIQIKRLKKIIRHAYDNVKFYNELYKKNNIRPGDIKSIDDLRKLPIITKEDIQKNYPKRIIAKKVNINKCTIVPTSGSTGISLKVGMGKKTKDYSLALVYYAFNELGFKFFQRYIHFLGCVEPLAQS